MSQSDTWLLTYGREKAKLVVASKTALLLFSSNVNIFLQVSRRIVSFLLTLRMLRMT